MNNTLRSDDPRHGTLHGYKGLRCRCSHCHAAVSQHNAERYAEFATFLAEIKQQPCTDCGGTYPAVCMDFDHRNPSQKSFLISTAAMRSRKAVLAEIAKCDLVCANCHRIRTAEQVLHGTLVFGRPRGR